MYHSVRRNEYVLLKPVGFRLPDIFADFLIELRPVLPRPIFHEFGRHARADAGDQQEFVARAGVEIDGHEGLAIELPRLLGRHFLVEQELVQLDHGLEGAPLDHALHDGRRHGGQRLQVAFGGGVGVDQSFRRLRASG